MQSFHCNETLSFITFSQLCYVRKFEYNIFYGYVQWIIHDWQMSKFTDVKMSWFTVFCQSLYSFQELFPEVQTLYCVDFFLTKSIKPFWDMPNLYSILKPCSLALFLQDDSRSPCSVQPKKLHVVIFFCVNLKHGCLKSGYGTVLLS